MPAAASQIDTRKTRAISTILFLLTLPASPLTVALAP
jgi:hypothetical protein